MARNPLTRKRIVEWAQSGAEQVQADIAAHVDHGKPINVLLLAGKLMSAFLLIADLAQEKA